MNLFNRTKTCAPKAALAAIVLMIFLTFWGMTHFVMRFLEMYSYFAINEEDSQRNIIEIDKGDEVKKILDERLQERQKAGLPAQLPQEGEGDPFGLP